MSTIRCDCQRVAAQSVDADGLAAGAVKDSHSLGPATGQDPLAVRRDDWPVGGVAFVSEIMGDLDQWRLLAGLSSRRQFPDATVSAAAETA